MMHGFGFYNLKIESKIQMIGNLP